MQGLWVAFSLAAALAAITSELKIAFGEFALVGGVGKLYHNPANVVLAINDQGGADFLARL